MAVFGTGAATTSYEEFENTDLIICWGSNAMEAHPIIYNHMRRGIKKGAKMVVVDPRKTDMAKRADMHLPVRVGTDIALANAMAHVIIEEGLENREFIDRATENFEALAEKVREYTPEYAEEVTGVPADDIRELARLYATSERATLNWTLGITEFHNGLDRVFSLINLGLLTGHVGKYGSGLNPLRGQNNVQGGGDMGALPNRLVGGFDWDEESVQDAFAEVWGAPIPKRIGKNQAQMLEAMESGEIRCMYVIGENPVQSDADENHSEELFAALDFLVVQDIFLTKTGRLADVVLPAAASWAETDGTFTNGERRVQRVRKAVEPPGEARDDIFILRDVALRLGASPEHGWNFESAEEVWDELRSLAPNFSGITYELLDRHEGIQWPCLDGSAEEIADNDPREQLTGADSDTDDEGDGSGVATAVVERPKTLGTKYMHAHLWSGEVKKRARFFPVDHEGPAEETDEEYPLRLTTGRKLAFYNTGTMTRNYKKVKDDEEMLEIHPEDAARFGIEDGDLVKVSSRRGKVPGIKARVTDRVQPGLVFTTFHFPDEAPINQLTINFIDPRSGTAELKSCAVKVEKA
ncbi:Molybdopterin oxidoreductase [Rubrobacter radiotolerans]|uniref:Molybdopterin oxidoreductase n=1 Tax=Rubrobacter radiotolerans TaxID=42256 RepID=A0A023X718_RUBRA|nr:Molybdopterin oxidoreductase [Rubrobacter radiotolerans]